MNRRSVCALALLVAGCGRGGPATPPCPSLPREALCIGNPNARRGGPVDVARGARAVCSALERAGLHTELITTGSEQANAQSPASGLWPDLARGWSDRPRIVYYEGHGELQVTAATPSGDTCRSGGLCLWTPNGDQLIPWTRLSEGLPPPGNPGQWDALLVNTCNSGLADIRQLPPRSTFLGLGFGALPSKAESIAAALHDPENDRNCDGIVTDRELRRALNPGLIASPPENGQAAGNSTAVLKHESDGDVPLLRMRIRSAACAGEPEPATTIAQRAVESLPCALQADLRAHVDFLDGRRQSFVESAVRYLLVVDERSCADQELVLGPEWSTLQARAESLGFVVARVPAELPQSLVRLLTFVHAYQLTISGSLSSLTSLYDGEDLATIRHAALTCGESGSVVDSLVERVLSCLPTRVGLVGTSIGLENLGCRENSAEREDRSATDNCTKLDGKQQCLAVRVDGRFPKAPPALVEIGEFLAKGAAARREPIALASAVTRACFSGEGQCFEVATAVRPVQLPGDWVVLEDGLEQQAREARQQECEHR